MHRRAARAIAVSTLALVAVALSGVFTTAAAPAATGRTLSVAPATDLGNQVVLAHWEGFNPRNGVIVQQCHANPVTLADCETANRSRTPKTATRSSPASPRPTERETRSSKCDGRHSFRRSMRGNDPVLAHSPTRTTASRSARWAAAHGRHHTDRVRQERGRLPTGHRLRRSRRGRGVELAGVLSLDRRPVHRESGARSRLHGDIVGGRREDFLAARSISGSRPLRNERRARGQGSCVRVRARRPHGCRGRLQHTDPQPASASPISR